MLSRAAFDAAAVAWVSVDGDLVGAILLLDPLRRDAPRTMRRLRTAGITRVVMLTGDRAEPAEQIAAVLGLDDVRARQTPADKVAAVRAERGRGVTVMVGDGVNDAPALAAATVGVAMGARGSTACSEAADIVLTTDRLDRLADAMVVARRSRRIAVQSAIAGMALSVVAMGFAAVGLLPPAWGALLQEFIDFTVIVNALRALRPSPGEAPPLPADTQGLIRSFSGEHDELRNDLSLLREAAGQIAVGDRVRAADSLRRVDDFVRNTFCRTSTPRTAALPRAGAPTGRLGGHRDDEQDARRDPPPGQSPARPCRHRRRRWRDHRRADRGPARLSVRPARAAGSALRRGGGELLLPAAGCRRGQLTSRCHHVNGIRP